MRNRLLSALLACVFILSLLPMSAFAASNLEIAASETTLVDGVADVTISLPVNPGIMSVSMSVKYPSGLELTGADDAKVLKNGVFQNTFTSPFTLTFGDDLSTENDASTGVIAMLHFKTTDGGASAPYAIEITDVSVIDVDMKDVPYSVKNGAVKTGSAPAPTPDANSLQIAASETTLAADNTADVTISLPVNPGIMSMSMSVKYPSGLELTGADDAKVLKNGVLQNTFTSPFTLTFGDDLSTENDVSTGVIATLHFKATDGGASAPYAIEITDVSVIDVDMKDVAYSVKNGSVTKSVSGFEVKAVATPAEGGTVTPDKTTAAANETVTLTVTPADGYQLETLTVDGATTKGIKVENNKFAMPAENVTVTATFKQIPVTPTEYDITYATAQNGSVDGVKKSEANKEITLTVTPNAGYELDTLTVDGEKTKNIAVTNNKFTMPAENVTVTATFKQIPVAPTEYDITYATAQNGSVDGVKKSEANKEITLTVTPNAGYELDTLTVDGATTKNIAVTNNKFTMPAENVTVTATFKQIPVAPTEYDITYATAQNGSVDGVKKSEANKEITLTVTPNAGYELDTLTVDGEKTKGIKVENNKFAMPAENVTVTATFKKVEQSQPGTNPSTPSTPSDTSQGCYIATSVYGSYDTPEVWTLRRFRDDVLGQTWYGRLFIKAYYATSPTLVRWFGDAEWFRDFWRDKLDSLVEDLQADGFDSTPYQDKDW